MHRRSAASADRERTRRELDGFQAMRIAERDVQKSAARSATIDPVVARIKSAKATYRLPPNHACSQRACQPENEPALIARGALSHPALDPSVYVCRYGVVHACRADRTCSVRVLDGTETCIVSGKAVGACHDGVAYGQAVTFVRTGGRAGAKAPASEDEDGRDAMIDLPAKPAVAAPIAAAAAIAAPRPSEPRSPPARGKSKARRSRSSVRRRKRSERTAQAKAWTSATVASGRIVGGDGKGMLEASQRRQCAALIDRLFYSERREAVHAERMARSQARAGQALSKHYQTHGGERGTTLRAAFAVYLDVAASGDRFCAPRQPRNEGFVRFFSNVCLVQWRLLRGSPWGRDNKSLDFEETCLAVLYCMHSGGKILFDRQALPRCDYVTRYAPLSSDLEAYGVPGHRLRNGTKNMRSAYNSISRHCVSSQVAFGDLQRDRWASDRAEESGEESGEEGEEKKSKIGEKRKRASPSLSPSPSPSLSTPAPFAPRMLSSDRGVAPPVGERAMPGNLRPRAAPSTRASPSLRLMKIERVDSSSPRPAKRARTARTAPFFLRRTVGAPMPSTSKASPERGARGPPNPKT